MKKSEVLKAIDEVMNNREKDSIRNAILAIRDKVLEMPDEPYDKDFYAVLELRCDGPLNCVGPYYEGAKYVVINTYAKLDSGVYGEYYYTSNKE